MRRKRTWQIVALSIAALGVIASSANAATAPTPPSVAPLTSCTAPTLSQPFLSFGDPNLYYLAPNGDFTSQGDWYLAGGATIASTTQADGAGGGVLDLPSKATATSPPMCITSDYPTARLWARNIAGSEGVFFNVQYWTGTAWTKPKDTGQFHGDKNKWKLSNPMNIQPMSGTAWQQVRFTFLAGGTKSRFQVDNFWVDPRASR